MSTQTAPTPRPPKARLTATAPVVCAVILVRPAPDNSHHWAVASDLVNEPATGSASTAAAAHLQALETCLTHPNHSGRRLTLDVEDTVEGRELADFVTEHIPAMPVTLHSDITRDRANFRAVRNTLRSSCAAAAPAPKPRQKRHIVAATDGSLRAGRPEGGWAWVTAEGRWKSGTVAANNIRAVEVYAILRLVAAHSEVDSLTIGSDSQHAIELLEGVRAGTITPSRATENLGHERAEAKALCQQLCAHSGDISFEWIPAHQGFLLNETADRLAVQARRSRQLDAPLDAQKNIARSIVTEMSAGLSRPRRNLLRQGRTGRRASLDLLRAPCQTT